MQKKDQYSFIKMFPLKTFFVLAIFSLLGAVSHAQFTLHIKIISLPATHPPDSIFIAGNFNGWEPGNEKYRFSRSGDLVMLDITGLTKDEYQFKFTRGSWEKGEVASSGRGINNRSVKLNSDTTVEYSIEAWADDFHTSRPHTASSNVQLIDTAFFIPQLYRTRKIWMYLPPGYATGKKRYPVLYMHDGQNIFDDYTSAFGEWGVDECLDSMIAKGIPPAIVVGIENGAKRVNEYNPYDNNEYGKGEGEEYIGFLVETLKPFIDKHYRTLSSKENTFIAGSSLGGLISCYAMLRYPDVFGKAGIFSPAFWIAPQLNQLTDSVASKINGQFFFYAGESESETMISNMETITEKLGEGSNALIYEVKDPGGKHNEQSWRKWFSEFYIWITGNGLSYQIKTGN